MSSPVLVDSWCNVPIVGLWWSEALKHQCAALLARRGPLGRDQPGVASCKTDQRDTFVTHRKMWDLAETNSQASIRVLCTVWQVLQEGTNRAARTIRMSTSRLVFCLPSKKSRNSSSPHSGNTLPIMGNLWVLEKVGRNILRSTGCCYSKWASLKPFPELFLRAKFFKRLNFVVYFDWHQERWWHHFAYSEKE